MAEKATEIGAVPTVGNWIGGEAVGSESDRIGDVFDSATGERCAQVAMSTTAETEAASHVFVL